MKENTALCRNWDTKNNCCRAKYNLEVSSKFEYVKFNPNDLKANCNGYSNSAECLMFIFSYYTDMHARRDRALLRDDKLLPFLIIHEKQTEGKHDTF